MINIKELFKVALRNVFRNRVRTILTIIAITIGIFVFLMSTSVISGIDETTIRNYLNAETAFIKIYDKNYYPDRKELYLENLISNYQSIIENIRAADKDIALTVRLKFRGTLSMPGEDFACSVIGVDTDNDGKVFNLFDSILSIKNISKDSVIKRFDNEKQVCLLGYKLADYIGAMPGDEILLSGRTMHGTYNADSFTVAGLVSSDNPNIDAFSVIIPLSSAFEFADTDGRISEIAVRTSSRESGKINPILEKINGILPENLAAYSWQDELADLLTIFKIRRVVQKILVAMLLTIAIAGITNTMLMAVMERTKEIGTLAAMGMKKRDITVLFLFEGMIIGVIGGAVALVFSAGPLFYLTHIGIQVKGAETLANIPISSRLYARIDWYLHLLSFAIGILTAVIASIYPAMKAAGTNIAETLRSK